MPDLTSPASAVGATAGVPIIGTGPGYDREASPAGVAATSTANAVVIDTGGAAAIMIYVTAIGTTPGSMIIETTEDDTNWHAADFVLNTTAGVDVRVEGSFVPAVGDRYYVRCAGTRQVRYRVNATYASGTATIVYQTVLHAVLVEGAHNLAAPHTIGYPILSATAQYTGTQTSTTLGPTVSSTQRLAITYLQIGVGGTTVGALQVYFGTGAYSRGTNKALFDHEFAPSATLKPGFAVAFPVPPLGAADEELKVTDSAAINPLTVTIWYYLITA